jgi:hypothetical protein
MRMRVILFLLLSFSTACTIGGNPEIELEVPYRAQALNSLDCGPASVLMWRLYDGFPEISQQSISTWMGGTCNGASAQDIADAVNHFTNAGDAYWDIPGGQGAPEQLEREFFARQITSIDNATPVIAIIEFQHAGVINGGRWHSVDNGRQWDYVFFHDPSDGPDLEIPSERWRNLNCPPGQACEQIISTAAAGGWSSNLQNYGAGIWDSGGHAPLNQQQ